MKLAGRIIQPQAEDIEYIRGIPPIRDLSGLAGTWEATTSLVIPRLDWGIQHHFFIAVSQSPEQSEWEVTTVNILPRV